MGQGIANVAKGETGELTPFQADKSTGGAFVRVCRGRRSDGRDGYGHNGLDAAPRLVANTANLDLINATSGYTPIRSGTPAASC